MARLLHFASIIVFFSACSSSVKQPELRVGTWRATLDLQGQQLPFNFEVKRDDKGGYDVLLRNADEKILLDEVVIRGDSIEMGLHVFDASLVAKINGDQMDGVFLRNYDKTNTVPFKATFGQAYRYEKSSSKQSAPDFDGKYEVKFINAKNDTTPSIGVFHQSGDSITGTFLTPTGDYRYLQGNIVDGRMQMSTFDGNHAYMFYATKENNNTIKGEYFSGKTVKETWIGIKKDNPVMPDAEKLTFLKDGYDKIEFSFPDAAGNKVSLEDPAYKGKVVVLQILGSWCPNCMDETNFLAPWYEQNKSRGVEIIGLAYERKPEFEYASARVKKMVEKLHIPYNVLIAGVSDKVKAGETLPMLNKVVAFPTTIFIGKDGKVKRIHTGFSGPGTGPYYQEFIEHFNQTINELLADQGAG